MKTIFLVKKIFLMLIVWFSLGIAISAQSPCPNIGPCDEPSPAPSVTPTPAASPGGNAAVTFSAMLEEMVANFVIFKDAFASTIEGTLGGYFGVLAYILAWIIAVAYFIQQAFRGEWDGTDILPFIGRIVICLLLLVFCGDVDGDGKRGDAIRSSAYIGYLLSYGGTANEPTGSFLNKIVDEQSTKFNKNYQSFVENKLMVKINGQEYPVKYPGMQGIQTVAAVYTGQGSTAQEQEVQKQEFWIGLEFQILNVCRSIIAVIDFFLLALYSFGILIMITVAPFMVCVYVNRDLAKRFTFPFFWTVLTICIVFPALSQAARFFAYLAGNVALGTNGNPIYTYDPKTFTIVANGDPTPMILVAVLFMVISIVCLAMSVILSYALVQGRLVEAISGLIANTFAGISNVGLSSIIGAYSTKLQSEGEKAQIQGAYESATTQAGFNLEAQKASANAALKANEALAESGYRSTMVNASAQMQASQQSALGQYLSGMANVNAEKFATVNGAVAGLNHNLANMNTEQKKAFADNLIELLQKNGDATSQRIAKEIELAPEKASLLAEQYQNILNGIPIANSVLKQLGVDKEAIDTWTRTEGFKTMGQAIFGDPNTMQGGILQNGAATAPMFERNRQMANDMQAPSMVYQRPDGTMIDAMTGQRLSNNVIDMTKPNNPIDYSKTPSIASVMGGGKGGGNFVGAVPKMTKKQKENLANLNQMMKSDPNFLPTLQRESWKRGINPNDMLNMLAIESSFRKNVINGDGYLGLGQVGSKERSSLGRFGWTGNNAVDLERVKNMTASQQLESLVFPFVDQKFGKGTKNLTMDKLYAGWGSGHFSNNPNYVHMEKGGKRALAYSKNPGWDYNQDGKVEQWEFGASAPKNLGAGMFFDANKALGQIRSADKPTAAYLGKKFSADATYANTMANNQQVFDGKNQATQAFYAQKAANEQYYTQEQINIANQKSQIQASGVQQAYTAQVQSSQTVFGGQSQAAQITKSGSLEAGQYNFQGTMESANIQFAGQNKVADITRNASLDALYKKNLANLVQQVGNSAAHQFSELFERASKGL